MAIALHNVLLYLLDVDLARSYLTR